MYIGMEWDFPFTVYNSIDSDSFEARNISIHNLRHPLATGEDPTQLKCFC